MTCHTCRRSRPHFFASTAGDSIDAIKLSV
jgi:hypothetical protein